MVNEIRKKIFILGYCIGMLCLNSCLLFEYQYIESLESRFWIYPSKDDNSYDKLRKLKAYNPEFGKRCEQLVIKNKLLDKTKKDWSIECQCDCYLDYSDNEKIKVLKRNKKDDSTETEVEVVLSNKRITIPTIFLPFITIEKMRKDRRFYWLISLKEKYTNRIKEIDTIILNFYKFGIIDTIVLWENKTYCKNFFSTTSDKFDIDFDTLHTHGKVYYPYRIISRGKVVNYILSYGTNKASMYLPVNKRSDTLIYYGIELIYLGNDNKKYKLSIDSIGLRFIEIKKFGRAFL